MSQHKLSPRKVAFLPPVAVVYLRRRAVEAVGLVLCVLATALALALATYNPNDAALNGASTGPSANWLGTPGAWTADLLLQTLGLASIAVVAVLASWAWRIASHRGLPWYGLRLLQLTPCLLLLAAIAGTVSAPEQWPQASGLGGYSGDWLLKTSAPALQKIGLTSSSPLVISIASFYLNPLVVRAGVPNLIPPGVKADLSPGTAFLFIDMLTYSHIFSILLPVIPLDLTTTITK